MDYTEAGYKIYGLWCEAGRPGTPEWGVSSIANIIRELDSRGIEPVTQAAPVSTQPICKHCGEAIEATGGKLYLWTHADPDQQKCTVAQPANGVLSAAPPRPKIICLCGSTRFIEQFAVKTWELELEGHIVLGCTLLPGWYCPVRDHFAESIGVKPQRDEHHLRKIDLADEILVLNISGYIGESTRNEIAYATKTGKPIKYLEDSVTLTPSSKDKV